MQVEVHKKYHSSGSRLVNDKYVKYKYYKCEYCGEEIVIKENKRDQDGGVVAFRGRKIAIHNKCLNPMLKDYERGNHGN